MKRILLAGAAVAALTTASFAADMPIAAPEAVAAPVTDWSGYFVGVQGGHAWTDVDTDLTFDGFDDGTVLFDADNFVGGLYYGRNWQSGSWVYGLDSSISFIGIDESLDEDGGLGGSTDFLSVEAKWLGASRLKVGYAFDNWLLYAAGGLAVSQVEVNVDDTGSAGFGESDDKFFFGFTVGAGVETKFSEHWSGRVEYLYVNLQDDFTFSGDQLDIDTDVELKMHIVRAGIAYHF